MLFLLALPLKANETLAFSSFDSMKSQADQFINKGKSFGESKTNEITNIMLPIGQFMVGVGVIVLVIVTIIMGIKFMTASDPNTQATLKKQLIGLVVSVIVILGAYGIWKLVYTVMEGIAT